MSGFFEVNGIQHPPENNPKHETAMWQQDYIADSGVQSNCTTRAPSISSKHGPEEVEGLEGNVMHGPPPPGIAPLSDMQVLPQTGASMPGMSIIPGPPPGMQGPPPGMQGPPPSRLQGPQPGMQGPPPLGMPVPGIPADQGSNMQVPVDQSNSMSGISCQPSTQQGIAQNELNAMANLINYQDDSELAETAIPELIRFLREGDQVVIAHATSLILDMSRKESNRNALISDPQMIPGLLHTIDTFQDVNIIRCCAGTLHNLSHQLNGLFAIFKLSGIPLICKLLINPIEAIRFYAITTLHNLLLYQDGAKNVVRNASGVSLIVSLLQYDNVKFLAICTDCLQILAYGHQASKIVILENNGPRELVRIMREYTYEKLLYTTSRLLKALCVCPQNKPRIVQSGGVQAIAMHLAHSSDRLVQICLWILRSLSDTACKCEGLEPLLQVLCQFLSAHKMDMVACAAGVLSNLMCGNQNNKMVVCQVGGIESLVRCIILAGDYAPITEPAICALRHITNRHPDAEMAQNTVRSVGGIPILVKLLHSPSKFPLIKATVGLIRNLALCPSNHIPLREHGAIPRIIQIMMDSHEDVVRHRVTGPVDGVRMEEILEMSVGALQVLSRDVHSRSIIRNHQCIPVFVQLLHSPSEGIQRVATGVLCEMAADKEGAEQIETKDARPVLVQLTQSSNEAIVTFATTAVLRLSEASNSQKKLLPEDFSASLFPEWENTEGATGPVHGNYPAAQESSVQLQGYEQSMAGLQSMDMNFSSNVMY